MDTAAPIQEIFRQKLLASLWSFGPTWGDAVTLAFGFAPTGAITGYDHPNERTWQINNGRLEIFDADGALMWAATSRYALNQVFCIALSTPRDPSASFILKETTPRTAPPPPPPPPLPQQPPAAIATPAALTPADYLFPKDLNITEQKFERIRLVGSCMTALYHEQFQQLVPETKFDYVIFNYAGEVPAPEQKYDLQYLQIPLRSVITDYIIWAPKLNDPTFVEETLATAYNVIDAMLESALSTSNGLLTLVSNFIVPQMSAATSLASRYSSSDIATIVRQLNSYLATALPRYPNTHLADVNAIADSIGKHAVLDDMIYFYSHNGATFPGWITQEHPQRIEPIPPMNAFYTTKQQEFVAAVWDQISATTRTIRQLDQVKAVIFDLDNTLWRGQLAEDYRTGATNWPATDGWPVGLWEAIHHLRARGIIVSLCSKNDEETVKRDWRNAVEPAFIKFEDFVSPKINWRPKAENILQICAELNIKPKSVVFVDDNPVERAAVKAALPDIRVIGANPYLTRRILLWAPETQIATLTTESAQRENMVRGQITRDEQRKSLTREEFLASLACQISFLPILDPSQPEFSRVIELTNKTNQFNTTGKRWSGEEISQFLAAGGDILSFRVKDRFTEYGLVGVLYCHVGEIIQFVMSCRVLGMDVELFALAHAVTLLRAKRGGGAVSAVLRETPDNAPCRDIFPRAGFEPTGPGQFELRPETIPTTPTHIREF